MTVTATTVVVESRASQDPMNRARVDSDASSKNSRSVETSRPRSSAETNTDVSVERTSKRPRSVVESIRASTGSSKTPMNLPARPPTEKSVKSEASRRNPGTLATLSSSDSCSCGAWFGVRSTTRPSWSIVDFDEYYRVQHPTDSTDPTHVWHSRHPVWVAHRHQIERALLRVVDVAEAEGEDLTRARVVEVGCGIRSSPPVPRRDRGGWARVGGHRPASHTPRGRPPCESVGRAVAGRCHLVAVRGSARSTWGCSWSPSRRSSTTRRGHRLHASYGGSSAPAAGSSATTCCARTRERFQTAWIGAPSRRCSPMCGGASWKASTAGCSPVPPADPGWSSSPSCCLCPRRTS